MTLRQSFTMGRIEAAAPVPEAECGAVRLKVLVDNPGGRFRAAVRCTLELANAPAEHAAFSSSPGLLA